MVVVSDPSATRDPLNLRGTTVGGKYVVEHAIGEGGAAIVYKAIQSGWEVPVAIKFLVSLASAPEKERPALFEEFRREGRLISELSTRSSAIVQPRDLGMLERPGEAPIPYLVLEWLDGKTLDEVIVGETNAGIPPRDLLATIKLLDPIARALAIAHAASVVHRDVKPENMIVLSSAPIGGAGAADPTSATGEVSVKLLDFGIAKVMQKRFEGVHQTGTMATAFTPHYGAPEQFSRTFGETGPWTDVLAMALVVLEVMRGGRRAFKGDDFAELARQSMDERLRPTPRTLRIPVTDEVESVFRRALAVRTDLRYQSMGEFWPALVGAASPSASAWTVGSPTVGNPAASASVPNPPADRPSLAQTGSAPTTPGVSGSRIFVLFAACFGLLIIVGASVTAGRRLLFRKAPASAAPSASTSPSAAGTAAAATSPSSAPTTSAATTPSTPCPAGMLVVSGGRFTMGSSEPGARDDGPAHTVFVDTFCLDESEVTVARYAACKDAAACTAPAPAPEDPRACTFGDAEPTKSSINCVTFEQATALCVHEGRRLPSEAEWELAASKSASPTLLDGLAEWTGDFFAPYSEAQQLNPTGPAAGEQRVVRGAAPGLAAATKTPLATHREPVRPDRVSAKIGFRCARALAK
jgi:formylglycine-generating enzyme required for sulfatase activity